jgi:EpsI family protein
MTKGLLNTNAGTIPVMHMVAIQGSRIEPITYWIRVGDTVVRGALEQNMARIKYGLTGKVPDGLLVRVSSISSNEEDAYYTQQKFVIAMLLALPPTDRTQLIGRRKL